MMSAQPQRHLGAERRPPTLKAHRISALIAIAFFAWPLLAHANAVVTLCGDADQPGSGLNFRNALLKVPDINSLINAITFACAGTIIAATPLHIPQATSIDGNNQITLLATLTADNANAFLYLYNLTLHHSSFVPPSCVNWLSGCIGSIVNGRGVTELHHVTVENANRPIAIQGGTVGIYDSQFTGNTDAVIVSASGTSTLIAQSVFKDNLGAAPLKAAGSISITNSQFINNGASYFDALAGAGQTCTLSVDGSTFTSNTANGALNVRCNATISHSMFSANASSSSGGAVAFLGAATSLTLRANKFLNNRTTRDGGAVYWQPLVPGDRAMTVSYSTFTSNGAMTGGAIGVAKSGFSSGTSTINVGVSAFSHNTASVSGGAISATDSQLFVARATFADNSGAIHGGAVSLENSTHTTSVLANALLVRNSAEYGSAFFGANATFINSTVDSNLAIAAVPGAAILNSGAGAASHIKLSNSIVSNNASGGCKPTGLFDDGGRNLQFPKSDCGKSITVADPHLDSMYIPVPKSAPMGNGDLKVCMSAPINGRDVYGLGRPSGGVCTIGAAEGDINVLTHNRVHNRQGSGQQASDCGCDNSLVQKIERLLPFYP